MTDVPERPGVGLAGRWIHHIGRSPFGGTREPAEDRPGTCYRSKDPMPATIDISERPAWDLAGEGIRFRMTEGGVSHACFIGRAALEAIESGAKATPQALTERFAAHITRIERAGASALQENSRAADGAVCVTRAHIWTTF